MITLKFPFNVSFVYHGSKFDAEGRTQGLWAELCLPPICIWKSQSSVLQNVTLLGHRAFKEIS